MRNLTLAILGTALLLGALIIATAQPPSSIQMGKPALGLGAPQ